MEQRRMEDIHNMPCSWLAFLFLFFFQGRRNIFLLSDFFFFSPWALNLSNDWYMHILSASVSFSISCAWSLRWQLSLLWLVCVIRVSFGFPFYLTMKRWNNSLHIQLYEGSKATSPQLQGALAAQCPHRRLWKGVKGGIRFRNDQIGKDSIIMPFQKKNQ